MPSPLLRGGACAVLLAAACLLMAPAVRAKDDGDACGPPKSGETCQVRTGGTTPGGAGTGNVSHAGWPSINGILWQAHDTHAHHRVGTNDNDELLGYDGSDTLSGGPGKDVLWGDARPNNPENQTDTLRGGAGNDFLYPSHGKNIMLGGPGNDRIIAYYGHGVIDCGPGTKDYAQTRENGAYTVKNCELVRHFCQYGSKPNGDCKKPGEAALARLMRQTDQDALLARLVVW
jgi:hypothetical protein